MSVFNASSSIVSPSRRSMARLVLPSRLALKRPEGSASAAPLAKVIFTTLLYVSPVQMIPACDHTGTPRHFHSSTISGSACLIRSRISASVWPRQSFSSSILASIRREGESPSVPPVTLLFAAMVAAFSCSPATGGRPVGEDLIPLIAALENGGKQRVHDAAIAMRRFAPGRSGNRQQVIRINKVSWLYFRRCSMPEIIILRRLESL